MHDQNNQKYEQDQVPMAIYQVAMYLIDVLFINT